MKLNRYTTSLLETLPTLVFLFCVLLPMYSTAQTTNIKTDASWGRTPSTLRPSAGGTTVTGNQGATYNVPGNLYTITEAQGRVAGSNLFHSFESFSVGTGDAALFTTTTATLTNVISRISGNTPSTINGGLFLKAAEGSKPNFFFINPNGVTFGAGAQVDVPAAFHVSTADSLNFADGTIFKARNGSDSTLTIAPPAAFGFLGNRPAAAVTGGGFVTFVDGNLREGKRKSSKAVA
jgi:filamentous hemagglutinin family protein